MIVTEFVHPPIPVRRFDWMAVVKELGDDSPIGHGATELEALRDLAETLAGQLTEKEKA